MISKAGGPDVLVDRERVPEPVGATDVRIEVAAAGVNFADVAGRIGTYQDAPPIPYCPGYEVAGTIVEIGREVTGFKVGDRVCALTRFGGYSEEVVTPIDVVWPVPDGVDLVAAAGVPVTYLTAHTCLFDAGALVRGRSVLILGGAGGVGSAALQLLRGTGITVLATAGSASKCSWMKTQGADHAINYNEGDVATVVKRVTGGRGVDAVLDPIGGRGIATSIAMCAPLGRVVLFGASSTNPGKTRSLVAIAREAVPMRFFNLLPLFGANVGIHAINMLALAEADPALMRRKMTEILARVAAGELAPVIAERYPLDGKGAAMAHHYLQDRKNIGKVVLVRSK
ncbi:MAG: zinc-binding dehydrogenase [Deltaproteobacteria bacterium]|nr:zinc-binding dehydrogenase [Deltaproteobacteria bacterium]